MTLVGTLPAAPVESVRDGPHELWPNAFHESVAAARTLLLHVARSDSLQVVMVTSASPGKARRRCPASCRPAWRGRVTRSC